MPISPIGPTPASILIVGEAPGQEEIDHGQPFVGYSGRELTSMLHEAGIQRTACRITNVVMERPEGNDISKFIALKKKDITPAHVQVRDKLVLPVLQNGIESLKEEIKRTQPTIIIAFGNIAMWALTGKWGIGSWRASHLELNLDGLPPIRVIPTYHPAAVLRQYSWRPIVVQDLRRAKRELESPTPPPAYNFIIRPTFAQAKSTLEWLLSRADEGTLRLANDLETKAGHTACCGIAWSPLDAICIPWMCLETPTGYFSLEEESHLCWLIYRLFTHPNVQIIGQNYIYDAQYFIRHHLFTPNFFRDTMLSQHTCFSTMQKGLDFLSSMYCPYHLYWKDEGKEWNTSIPEDQYWAYNCKDACITYEIDSIQEGVVTSMGLEEQNKFQQSMFYPVLRAMERGVNVDLLERAKVAGLLRTRLADLNAWMEEILGHPINVRSTPQMQKLFYEDLNQPKKFKRKTGNVTLDDEALEKLAYREPLLRPLVENISEQRSLGVLLSTFIEAPLDIDKRLRCSYNIAGTDTYRLSSRENAFGTGTNLQNFPLEAKSILVPDLGMTMFDMDLSSADLRVVVWESGEDEMKALLAAGLNPYVEVAKEYYRDPSITKAHPKYRTFKSFAHGTHYLGTPQGMAGKLGMLVSDVERLQKWYFNRFPRIKQWQDRFQAKVLGRRCVENVFGYRLYILGRTDGNTINEAIAWLPQSTIALLINHAWRNIHDNLPDVQILLQTHDSLTGQYPTSRPDLLPLIESQSLITLPYPDPLIIPVGIKTSTKSWGDCE